MAQLATRLRPQSLRDIIGQEHLTGPDDILTRMVKAKRISSIILHGPPGTGKTSIAHALSGDTGIPFAYFNASIHAKKDLQDLAKKASPDNPLIVLIDEIHRLDKTKQDFLLPLMEDGSFIIVGATTENPYISIAPAVRSRGHIFEVKPVEAEAIATYLESLDPSVIDDRITTIHMDTALYHHIAERVHGDVRAALNTLELIVRSIDDKNGVVTVTKDDVETCLQQTVTEGDKDGDSHYNLLSAFQKSIRGSDVDASLHYLGRLVLTGDLVSIVRRLNVIGYEDIGLANPELASRVPVMTQTAERLGFPEARIPLAQCVIELALSAKSNHAYKALDKAIEAIQDGRDLSIPKHLRDTHYKGAERLGHVGYIYPHDFPYHIAKQTYLPEKYLHDAYFDAHGENSIQSIQNTYEKLKRFTGPK